MSLINPPTSSKVTLDAAGALKHGSHSLFIPPSYLTPSPTIGSPSSASTPQHVIPRQNTSGLRDSEKFVIEQIDTKKKKNGRKGCKKSRTGCLTCKKQKLKCKENRPTCDYCAHRAIKCEWPNLTLFAKPVSSTNKRSQSVAPLNPDSNTKRPPTRAVSWRKEEFLVLERPQRSLISHDAPPVNTSADLRLFNHFLQKAFPNHPAGNEAVWTHEVPSLSSQYDYLINSMLALSASELSLEDRQVSPSNALNLHLTSLLYRSRAVSSLSRAIQRGIPSSEEGNAMLATIFSLLFQSTFIADGIIEFMTFARGAVVVSNQMGKQGLKILFKTLEASFSGQTDDGGVVDNAPRIQEPIVKGGIESLELCGELCRTDLEARVWVTLMETAKSLADSSSYAYIQLRRIYLVFAHQMTPKEFHDYTSPKSPSVITFRILQAHLVALQLIMNPVAKMQVKSKSACPVRNVGRMATVGWLTNLHAVLKDLGRDLKGVDKYTVWTRWVEREILDGRLVDGTAARRSMCEFREQGNAFSSSKKGSISRCPRSGNAVDEILCER